MGRGGDAGAADGGTARKRSKGQKRLERILREIPAAREQLLAAIEDLSPQFDVSAIQEAMQSGDPRERNKVAVIERELDVLIAYLEELASRGLSEGQRIDVVPQGAGHAVERLAELNVISQAAAQRLQDVKDMRNQLAHAYPPASWRSLHQAVEALLGELDSYKVKVADWLKASGILGE
jgi:uncharacterized protein YutE (UPF0331/DUF86 family)